MFNFDLYAQREIPIKERARIQLRLEAFNALNHPILAFQGPVAINSAKPALSNTAITSANGDNRDIEAAIHVTW